MAHFLGNLCINSLTTALYTTIYSIATTIVSWCIRQYMQSGRKFSPARLFFILKSKNI